MAPSVYPTDQVIKNGNTTLIFTKAVVITKVRQNLFRGAVQQRTIHAMRPSSKSVEKKRTRAKSKPHRSSKPSKQTYPFETDVQDTSQRGYKAFEWLFHPIPVTRFFDQYFETEPLHLQNDSSKFASLSSIPAIKKLLKSHQLSYSELDVTSYTPSTGRSTHNEGGVAGTEAWDRFSSGCSLRLRRPQSHFDGIHKLCSYLESFLECVVGANIYLTPGNSQGFAAHFDDVDAVICQITGTKHWRIYKRADEHDVLPRRSSVDFSRAQVEEMNCILDVVLQEGDVLYLPRGAVHEARCDQSHSLHVTISFCQRWTWADLLLGSFERAVLETAAVDKRLRESVPLRFGRYAGAGMDGGAMGERFERRVRRMVEQVAKNYPVDYAVDKMMERFVTERLPTIGNGRKHIVPGCCVRLIASCCVRLVVGDDGFPVVVTRDARQRCLPEEAGGIKYIVDRYPEGVKIEEIPLENRQDRLELAEGLVDMGVLEIV